MPVTLLITAHISRASDKWLQSDEPNAFLARTRLGRVALYIPTQLASLAATLHQSFSEGLDIRGRVQLTNNAGA